MPLTPEERLERKRAGRRKWKVANRAKSREYQQEYGAKWRQKNPGYNKIYLLRRNISLAGRSPPANCEICGASGRQIVFDHCHQRNVFRGWICYQCNAALGCVQDDPNHLRKLIAYLERTKGVVSPQLTLPGM